MTLPPLYIFDLDGTMTDTTHRQHILDDKTDKQRWDKFYAACDGDRPKKNIIQIFHTLQGAGAHCWLFSGRVDSVEDKTWAWLRHYKIQPEFSRFRPAGDNTPDDILKKQWYDEMSSEDRLRLVAVFDDRDRVVKMWRENFVTCVQVAYGSF